jgi:penicillin amidase
MAHAVSRLRPLAVLSLLLAVPAARAEGAWESLQVGDEVARIYRDGYGTPHVFAGSNRALFEAYGWVVAEDRLFQADLNRRAARGRLSALLGPSALDADKTARTVGYTDGELRAMYGAMTAEEREIYDAYVAGLNRYLDAIADGARPLPAEYVALGAGFGQLPAVPDPWTIEDSMAFGAYMVRRFGEIGGRELRNLQLYQALVGKLGAADGAAVFDDVRWQEDPDAPVTVPGTGAVGKRQRAAPGQLRAPALEAEFPIERAKEIWQSLGVPTKLGSYAWVVSARKSASGIAMLYGGPQMGASAPEVLHEVQLTGGNGFHVVGMAFAGVPAVLIGRNDHVAWTSTTATGDNLDHYAETLCDAGAGPGTGTVFRGGCAPLQVRTETIAIRVPGGATSQALAVARSVHGPIVTPASGGVVYAQKRAHWLRELETGSAFFGFDRARNLNAFEAAVRKVVTSHNFLYVDLRGNVAYWQAGQVPVRPDGFDTRLPLPGDGSAEWTGGLVPVPRSVNPVRGWLANWNNKPEAGYPAADEQIFGKQGRLLEIERRLASGRISHADMEDIPKDIARVSGNGREARWLRPYLLQALGAFPPANPLAPAARAVVEAWSENGFADAVTSTTLEPGQVIFQAWLDAAVRATFADELGAQAGEASSNMLLHALDFAATGRSGVPPSRDYFGGVPPGAVLSAAFDGAVAALAARYPPGTPPSAWTAPRGATSLTHPVFGKVASFPTSNRATYAQVVVADGPGLSGESVFTLGQSGFVGVGPGGTPAFDPHFFDQLPLYTAFAYKPQHLYRNEELKE